MHIRALGGTGLQLSAVGLGGFELGGDDAVANASTRADAIAAIEAALASGINWLDTAESYHDNHSEALIGEVLQCVRGDILVSTKLAPQPDGTGFRRNEVHAGCRASLERLRRDQIDIYFLHWPDDTGVPLDETWGALTELIDEGLVRAIGLSNYSQEDVERCHAQRPVDVVQSGLSLIDYLDNREPIARCGELGIGVVIYEPLGSGVLTGKSLAEIRTAWAGEYEEWPFYKRLLAPGKGEQSLAVADRMRPVAARVGATVPQLAIAWVLHQPGVTAALAGSSRPVHVRQNAQVAELQLSPEIFDELEALIPLGPTVAA